VNTLPDELVGRYAHYEHRCLERNGWEFCDIKGFIRRCRWEWMENLDNWEAELSEMALKVCPWWWLTRASRLYLFYPNTVKSYLFAVGLVEYCESVGHGDMYLVGFPQIVGKYIEELRRHWEICSITRQPKKSFLHIRELRSFLSTKTAWPALRVLGRNLLLLCWMTIQCLRKQRKTLQQNQSYKILVLSILGRGENALGERDYYYGRMFESLESVSRDEVLFVYLNGPLGQRIKVRQHDRAKTTSPAYVFLEDLVKFSDCFKGLMSTFRTAVALRNVKRNLPPLRYGESQSDAFPKEYWKTCMADDLSIGSFFVYFLSKRLLKRFKAKALIYPYEERGFERAILKACSEMEEPLTVIGYHHGIHTNAHIFYRTRPEGMVNPPRPDIVGVGGPGEKKWFIGVAKTHPSMVSVIGSARYPKPVTTRDEEERPHSPLRILVLTGFGYELMILANYLQARDDLFQGTDVIVRKKPYAIQTEADVGIERLKRIGDNIKIETNSLIEQVEWCDVVLYCTTTAGFEAMLLGRLAIYVDLCDLILTDPVKDKGDSEELIRCFSVNDLKKSLDRVRHMSRNEYSLSVRNQIGFAEQLISPVDEKGLSRLIGKITG